MSFSITATEKSRDSAAFVSVVRCSARLENEQIGVLMFLRLMEFIDGAVRLRGNAKAGQFYDNLNQEWLDVFIPCAVNTQLLSLEPKIEDRLVPISKNLSEL